MMGTLDRLKGLELVGSGTQADLENLGDFEAQYAEGQRGVLELRLKSVPWGADAVVAGIDTGLRSAGVTLSRDSERIGNRVRIHFRKLIPPLLLIAAIVIGALLILLIGFSLYKVATLPPAKLAALVALAVIVVALLIFVWRRALRLAG